MITVKGSGGTAVELEVDMAARVAYVVGAVESAGGTLYLTEGYRPVGVPGDQYVRREPDTESGRSTQWFQWGRYQRGETPSAAYPGSSRHGTGCAIDWNAPTARDMQLRARFMADVGLVANVASESWHAEALGVARVAYVEPARVLKRADIDTGRVVHIAGHGTRCWLLHSGGVLECATPEQVDLAFTLTGQSRTDIPTVSRAEFDAWASHIHWQTTAGVFKVLDRHEAVLRAIKRKVTT